MCHGVGQNRFVERRDTSLGGQEPFLDIVADQDGIDGIIDHLNALKARCILDCRYVYPQVRAEFDGPLDCLPKLLDQFLLVRHW